MGSHQKEFPLSIDINPTSRCQLSCDFCWGPNHTLHEPINTIGWKNIIDFFASNGVKGIVFTGGEPLMRPDIVELVRFSKKRGLRTTLSTNTILLPQLAHYILPYVDEIGIPMDGSSSEINNIMRKSHNTINSFEYQTKALSMVKANHPEIQVTVRTVMSKLNHYDMHGIGELLNDYKRAFDRWKIYQFAPFSYGELSQKYHWLSNELFENTITDLTKSFPDHNVVEQYASSGEGRYIFVGSRGDVYGVGPNFKYEKIGDFMNGSYHEISENISSAFDEGRNAVHAI